MKEVWGKRMGRNNEASMCGRSWKDPRKWEGYKRGGEYSGKWEEDERGGDRMTQVSGKGMRQEELK